jgi:hypothetical protein
MAVPPGQPDALNEPGPGLGGSIPPLKTDKRHLPMLAAPGPSRLGALLSHLFASGFAHPLVYRLLRRRLPTTLSWGIDWSATEARYSGGSLFRRCVRGSFLLGLTTCHEFPPWDSDLGTRRQLIAIDGRSRVAATQRTLRAFPGSESLEEMRARAPPTNLRPRATRAFAIRGRVGRSRSELLPSLLYRDQPHSESASVAPARYSRSPIEVRRCGHRRQSNVRIHDDAA